MAGNHAPDSTAEDLQSHSADLDSQRVEHALRQFQKSWADRLCDRRAVEQDLDELDIAVGLWLDVNEPGR